MSNDAGVAIIRAFRGLYDTLRCELDPHALAERLDFIKPSEDGQHRVATESRVIRTAYEFLRFIDGVPEKVMDLVPSPRPSDDSLLERPAIDFDSYMVLAIIAHAPNRFIHPEIVAVERTPAALRVACRFAEPGPVVQKNISYGAYCAVVVPRFDGEVIFAQE